MIDRNTLAARLAALPEAALPSIERAIAMAETAAQPAPGTQAIVAGATITARPDLVYQGEVARKVVSQR